MKLKTNPIIKVTFALSVVLLVCSMIATLFYGATQLLCNLLILGLSLWIYSISRIVYDNLK